MKKLSDHPKWLKSYLIGIEHPEKVLLFLEGNKYAIIKHPGGSFWSGWGMSYCSPWYVLIKKDGKNYWSAFHKQVHEGRINKVKKQELQKLLDEYDRK